jgi:hypothetical protein
MLPEDTSLLRHYVYHASKVTDANAGHHVAAGLVLLTQTTPTRGVFLADHSTFNNVYALVTASSGARKSETLKMAVKVARRAGMETLVTSAPGSREGFIDSLDPNIGGSPRQGLVYSEFADFLGITAMAGKGKMGGHAVTLRGAVMDAYDGIDCTRRLASRRDRDSGQMEETVRGTENPRVSLIGAANYHVLSKHTTAFDWMDGFMGRFLLFSGEMERWYFRQQPWPRELEVGVVDALKWRCAAETERALREGPEYPACAPDDLTPEAMKRLEEWGMGLRAREAHEHMQVQAALKRIMPLAQRIALILSLDYGEAHIRNVRPGWRLTLGEIEPAIFLAERHLDAYRTAVENVVLNEEERPIREVEHVIRRADNDLRGMTDGEIGGLISRNVRTVKEALEALVTRGVIIKRPRRDSTTTEWVINRGRAETVIPLHGVAPLDTSRGIDPFAPSSVGLG